MDDAADVHTAGSNSENFPLKYFTDKTLTDSNIAAFPWY